MSNQRKQNVRYVFRCEDCEEMVAQHKMETVTRGTLRTELILWFLFFPAGFLYSLWRVAGRRHNICPECGGECAEVYGYVPKRPSSLPPNPPPAAS